MTRALALALLLVPAMAFAQEAQKFNLKALEKEFAPIPVYNVKGAVVDNEVVVSSDPKRDFYQAVYVLRVDVKKAVEFYKTKLAIEPKAEGEQELGTMKYTFAPKIAKGEVRVFKVMVAPTDAAGATVVTLMHRKVTADDDVAEE